MYILARHRVYSTKEAAAAAAAAVAAGRAWSSEAPVRRVDTRALPFKHKHDFNSMRAPALPLPSHVACAVCTACSLPSGAHQKEWAQRWG
mmetsp:Transcript_63808/g.132897  ORF Transcript_63808/g.132897 Transcript_63808/m.132897 type:complete len:90 (+) Transcript_63808:223-492(+)